MSPTSPTLVEVWQPNKSNTSRNSNTPCGFLVKNRQCLNPGCDFSHETWRVRSWQSKHASKPCRWGEACPHFTAGNCLYYHPLQHAQSEHNRETVIKKDLRLTERLYVHSLVAEQDVGIRDMGDLASFNKLSDDEIAVPGCPPRFHPITEPLAVTLDWHNTTLQPSFAKYTHIFEPLLRSLQATDPTFDVFSAADIVSNASNLRKLFHVFSNKKKLTERFDLEWRHNTLFLSKWTGDPSLRSSLGHGTGFEKETCRYADHDDETIRNSSSHHRVVWYNFAGLHCVIQSEVDGHYCECDHPTCALPSHQPTAQTKLQQYLEATPKNIKNQPGNSRRGHRRASSPPSPKSTTIPHTSPSYSRSPPNPTKLSRSNTNTTQFSRFSALLSLDDPGDTPSFSSSSTSPPITQNKPPPPNSSTLKVHLLPGRNIPSPCLIEVKTHKANNKPMFAPEAQLYFCRRTKLFVAQHRAGVFLPQAAPSPSDETETALTGGENNSGGDDKDKRQQLGTKSRQSAVEDKTGDLVKWERDNQVVLGKVAALLRLLIGKMREREEGERSSFGLGMDGIRRGSSVGRREVQGISVIMESDGKGKVKGGLYLRVEDGEDVKSLLPGDV